MNEELIKRIDAYIDCDDVRERESETQLLEDCRAALSRKYVPMTEKQRAKWWSSDWANGVMLEKFEREVIRRAGLDIEK